MLLLHKSNQLIRYLINYTEHTVINIDKLTYAGNLTSLESVARSGRYFFENLDICSFNDIGKCFCKYKPDAVVHLAAESHVDKSITGPKEFIFSNIVGTYNILEQARLYWSNLSDSKKNNFRFHHVSTDEVYGDLQNSKDLFSEEQRNWLLEKLGPGESEIIYPALHQSGMIYNEREN